MITIAAGSPEVGASLRKLLGTDALHSFLPKPINASLVRLAVESGKRHYLQARALKESEPHLLPTPATRKAKSAAAPQLLPTPPSVSPYIPGYRNDFGVDDFDESRWRQVAPKIAAAVVVTLAVIVGAWYGWREYSRPPSSKALAAKEIELAERAFDGARYATADGAIYHYNQALTFAPQDPRALTGIDRTIERIIEQAETALMEERLDAAAEAIAAVRTVEPSHKRLPFLESQLDKARRLLAPKSESHNIASDVALANDTAPISNETQRQQLIARWLTAARQRLVQNRLLAPENDSAEFYLRQIERADPGNISMQQGLREIGSRLIGEAREALSRQQLQLAKRRADEAQRFGVDRAIIDRLLADIASASDIATRGNFLRLALQRTRENQLFDPDRDNAKFYLGQLQLLDPASTETAQATRALGLKLIENADIAIAQQQMSTATQLLNEARRLGFNGSELAAAEARARIARTPITFSSNNTTVAAPKAIKVAPAKFPEDAMRAGVAGWVDVSFHITASGDVTNAVPVASNPPGQFAVQFERAAVAAIRQYKFEPRALTDTQTQTMVVRVQFKLQ
jgi:protein TonB